MIIVKYNKPKIYRVTLDDGPNITQNWLTLKPGANEVDESRWAKAEIHPHVIQKIEDGEIEIIKANVDSIKDLSPQKAIDVVKNTFDYKLLKKWSLEETRTKVKSEIDIQTRKLVSSDKVNKDNKDSYAA